MGLAGRLREQPANPEGRMSLVDHLVELRSRLFKSALGVVAGTIAGYFLWDLVFRLLRHPYCALPASKRQLTGGACELLQFTPLEAFNQRMKWAVIIGIILSMPVWLWQLWRFIAPALYKRERRMTTTFVVAACIAFAIGAAFAYLILTNALDVLLGFGGSHIASALGISTYLNFVFKLMFAFGIAFEVPVFLVMLNFAGIMKVATMRKFRRVAIFLIFVLAAVTVPTPDPWTMLAMAVPLCLAYELCVLIASYHDRKLEARQAAEAARIEAEADTPSLL